MSSIQKIDLGLKKAYDELFLDEKARAENRQPRIQDIPLDLIDDFPDHPFRVRMDEDMEQLVQSIRNHGIITPVKLRSKEDGRYEIVSGHRRRKACELLSLPAIPSEVREMTRDEAIIMMVESNLQRSTILPSEKAFSYKMRLEAMKRQGQRTDLTSVPVGQKSGETSRAQIAKASPDSNTQIQRYIRLTNLIPPLLDLVDEGKIAMRPAVELSYLSLDEQCALHETMQYDDCTPSLAQAIKMREFSKEGRLNADVILSIISEEKPNQREKLSFPAERLRPFLPKGFDRKQTEDYICKALEYYQRYRERQKDRER